jgi:hypothetical protein
MATHLVLFAISWIGILFLLVGVYVLILILRGLRDLAAWAYDVFVVAPREEKQLRELREKRRRGEQ